MKLAVSNIAWPADSDSRAFELLAANGFKGIEVAPTRVWPQWQGANAATISRFRRSLESLGLEVSSLQAILFQKPMLVLFGSDEERRALYDHLCRCADMAADLGASCLVFGAPGNRDRGSLSEERAFAIASDFFRSVGRYYAERRLCLVFEPNPPEYRCNFVTESASAARLVRAVGSEGFRLHLDTACLQLAGESGVLAIERNSDILRHFHVSEPYLGTFSGPAPNHSRIAQALRAAHYDGWVVVEMRAADNPLPALEEAVSYVGRTYGDGR